MNNNIPNKLILTCNISGKVCTWTNKSIIQKHINKHGSLEAFLSSYVSKGAGKVSTNMDKKKSETKEQAAASFNTKAKIVKPILEQGIKLGKMTEADYKRFSRVQTLQDGSECTIVTYAHEQVGNAS
jgi:hypothetical protein